MIKSVLEYIFCKTKKEEFAVQPYYVEVNLFTIPGISSYHTTLQIKESPIIVFLLNNTLDLIL